MKVKLFYRKGKSRKFIANRPAQKKLLKKDLRQKGNNTRISGTLGIMKSNRNGVYLCKYN